jgi:hypothetical protein
MPLYRKRAVTIEAVQFTGDNVDEVSKLGPDVVLQKDNKLIIITLEGDMRANVGDWIIKGVADELYPCRHDVFLRTYEPADA